MSKGKQLWPGDEMATFFRAHIRRETALEGEAAERLALALTKAVNRMLVREMPPELPPELSSELPSERPSETLEEPAVEARKTRKATAPAETQDRHDRAENFNPYRFSALVTLSKHGREGLMTRLQEIKSAENLRAFAEAQHVPVEPSVKRTDDIRKAIIAGVERRLADRKAAAS
ncbi:hypothetical protein [Hyphomicrobium facile]|uniref:Uncharacterized protein n=1 Tax=Hyphomicrobium facile TaxID=51670 RepID=A0A1I7MZX1_9HYPH|nr:hypothetical protein [Hyphomicrobium facile]SFV27895.1 hypothetical protein SAMN04488557_0874 [Hyphomicrobium facile]